MKKTAIAVSAIVALLLVGGAAAVLANQGPGGPFSARRACSRYTIGETLPLSTMKGHYYNATSYKINGKANGTFTFHVSQAYASGCVLSISGGKIYIGSIAYSVVNGTVLIGQWGLNGNGLGATSSGSFLFSITGLHGNSTKAGAGAIQLDFRSGTSEFLVQLYSWTPSVRR